MRKFLTVVIIALAVSGLRAQDSEIQTLFSGGTRISGFGGPMISFTTVNGEFANMMGGGGGVLLGDFFLGGYGEGLTNGIPVSGNRIDFGHGGFWTGYSFFAHRPFHPTVSAQMGWGAVSETDYNFYELSSDNIFVFNPAIELEMNFTRFFRLSVGVHYRIVTGANPSIQTSNLTNSDLSGPGALLAFKFGWF
ncbi:hypothetical protein ACFLR8_00190 [Bacteroidota bacterium]